MLSITIPATEQFDEIRGEFVNTKEHTLQLEHSLVSISKWESKWHKSFINTKDKTNEETIDYIKCMTLNKNIPDEVYTCLTQKNVDDINRYIEDPMTATTFSDDKNSPKSREILTSELIYYYMIASGIPIDECQKWHINRLLTLIRVCNIKSQPAKKLGKKELMRRNAAINEARKKQLNSKG